MNHRSGCFRKQWYPQIINFSRVLHYFHHPFLGTPFFWKHPSFSINSIQVVFFFYLLEVVECLGGGSSIIVTKPSCWSLTARGFFCLECLKMKQYQKDIVVCLRSTFQKVPECIVNVMWTKWPQRLLYSVISCLVEAMWPSRYFHRISHHSFSTK